MRVVLDANVVFSGAGWHGGEAHSCLVAMARRRFIAFATDEIIAELRGLVSRRGFKTLHSPHTVLEWYYHTVKRVEPVPLGKQRSRDAKDDPYLSCALAARAEEIISFESPQPRWSASGVFVSIRGRTF